MGREANDDPGGSEDRRFRPPKSKRPRNDSNPRSRSPSRRSRSLTSSISFDKEFQILTNTHNNDSANIPIQNDFGILNNNVMEHEVIRTPNNTSSKINLHDKLPPITVFGVSISELSTKVHSLIPNSTNIKFKLTQFGTKIFVDNTTDYKTLRSELLKSDMKCYTHRLKNEQTRKYVMYGLYNMNVNTLMENLAFYDVYPTEIRQLNMKRKRYDDQTIYLLYFKNEDKMTLEKLRTIKHVDRVIVKFETYLRRKTGPILCANCLHYGHGQSTCNMKPRCIKCGSDHKSSLCEHNLFPDNPKSKIPQQLVKCANCGGPHTANYSECPERLKYLEIRKRSNEKHPSVQHRNKNFQHIPSSNKPISHNIMHNSNDRDFVPNRPTYAKTLQSSNDLLSPNECYNMFKDFMNAIMKCKTRQDQIDTIARLSLNFAAKYDAFK